MVRLCRRASVTVDALIATAIVALGAVGLYSLTPVVYRTQQMTGYRERAVLLGNRMVEHLQLLTPSTITLSKLQSLNLVEANQTAQLWKFDRIPMDEASLYSPAQSLPSGQGRITTTTLSDGSVRIVVQISWIDRSQRVYYTTGTILGGYR